MVLSSWYRLALNVTTVTVVAYFLASSAAVLTITPRLPSPGNGVEGIHDAVKRVSIPSLKFFSPILSRNAFKAAVPKPKSKPKPKKPSIDKLSVAKVDERLLGTIYSDVIGLSRAVILKGNKQSLVKVGDKLSGFTIAEVKRRAIVLEKSKQRQLLLIDSADKKIAAKKSEARIMLSRKALKSKLQDLDSLSRDIQLAPATRGKQQGLWVRQVRSGSLFSKAGLQKDDVILTVGGEEVAKGANPIKLFGLLDRPQVDVNILRNGKPMSLVLLLTGN